MGHALHPHRHQVAVLVEDRGHAIAGRLLGRGRHPIEPVSGEEGDESSTPAGPEARPGDRAAAPPRAACPAAPLLPRAFAMRRRPRFLGGAPSSSAARAWLFSSRRAPSQPAPSDRPRRGTVAHRRLAGAPARLDDAAVDVVLAGVAVEADPVAAVAASPWWQRQKFSRSSAFTMVEAN